MYLKILETADPSFLHGDYINQPVYDFLKNFRLIQILKHQFANFLGNGWSWDDYKDAYMAQRSSFPIYENLTKIRWLNNHTLCFMPSFFANQSATKGNLSNGFEVTKSWDQNDFTFINGNKNIAEIPFRPDEKTIQNLLAGYSTPESRNYYWLCRRNQAYYSFTTNRFFTEAYDASK